MESQRWTLQERTTTRPGVGNERVEARGANLTTDVAGLRTRVDEQLNRLADTLMNVPGGPHNRHRVGLASHTRKPDAAVAWLQARIAMLGQLAAGLAVIGSDAIPLTGAGYGSSVIGEEIFSGRRHEYTLMLGSLVDIDAGQVSLASPIGQALFGREIGAVVEIELPHRRLRLRIVSVTTINDMLECDVDLITVGA